MQSDLTSNNFHFFKNDQINAVGLDCRNKYQSAKNIIHLKTVFGQKIALLCINNGDVREVLFLYKWISVVMQHFNALLLHDSLVVDQPM